MKLEEDRVSEKLTVIPRTAAKPATFANVSATRRSVKVVMMRIVAEPNMIWSAEWSVDVLTLEPMRVDSRRCS